MRNVCIAFAAAAGLALTAQELPEGAGKANGLDAGRVGPRREGVNASPGAPAARRVV